MSSPPSPAAGTLEAAHSGGLPTSGLDWVCRLLWSGSDHVRATRGQEPLPAGFRLAEAYLPLPRAASPRLLVPLGSARAAAAALSRNHDATSRKSRLVKAGLGAGLRLGLAQRLLPDRVQVAVAEGIAGELRRSLLTEELREVFGRRDLHVAVILGTPRPNRKPVLQVLSRDGEVLGYVKAAWNDLTRSLVRNEAGVLAELGRRPPGSFTAPRLLHHGPWGGLELLAASPLPHTVRPREAQVFEPPLPVIREVAALPGVSEAPLAESPYWAGVRARLAARAVVDSAPDPLGPIVEHVQSRFGRTALRFGAWHGDFTPWNMARLDARGPGARGVPEEAGRPRGQRIFVWDWERSGPAPVGLDLLHFLFQSVCRFEGRKPARSVEICRERTPGLLSLLDVPAGSESALWSVYRMELLFRYDEARLAGVLGQRSRIHTGILEMFEREMEAP